MTPELQNTLAALAQKLGTSVEYLWLILVAKTKVDAGINIVWLGVLGLVMAFISWKAFKELMKEHNYCSYAPMGWGILMGICGLAACLLLSGSVSNISDFIYPEAAAIHSIVHR